MAMLIGLMASFIVFSSFDAPTQQTKEECSQLVVSVPKSVILYQGKAWQAHLGPLNTDMHDTKYDSGAINIEVVQYLVRPDIVWVRIQERYCLGDACSEPYAFALKENPKYNPNDDRKVSEMKYYVTSNNTDYFFDM